MTTEIDDRKMLSKENSLNDNKSPRSSFTKTGSTAESSPTLVKPNHKVNFQRPQPGQPAHPPSRSMMPQVHQTLHRASQMMPPLNREQMWLYAVAYVALYTFLMLFRTSTFGFICLSLYTGLVTLLALRHFGLGPLADHFNRSR
ncbi:uncharacterized protein LOC128988881 [Macrosteles quadrilineatus]|uniref:uncharacterized protein LOC128988881 n=1 Tax=Macrosteles quadrilineatus TaxID=74068 RepID=UPI0023E27199|nr:uncharacterized protein LOC128988881 [Macrosteles quadrilineatus]XP_054266601.1 uncharacterized protein LOC128988881 [Macrosteles quadrilineatus]